MNKSKKLKILLTSFAAVATTGVVTTTVASCGKNADKGKNTPIGKSMSAATSPFTQTALNTSVTAAIKAHLGDTKFSLDATITSSNMQVGFTKATITTASANLTGKVTIGTVTSNYTASAIFTYSSKTYVISNLKIHIAGTNIGPAITSIFASNKIIVPVNNALGHKFVGSSWTLAPAISVTNVKTFTVLIQGNPITTSTANIYGIVTINGINKRFSANVSYNSLNNSSYIITNLKVIMAVPSDIGPAMRPLTPFTPIVFPNQDVIKPADSVFSNAHLHILVAQAINKHLLPGPTRYVTPVTHGNITISIKAGNQVSSTIINGQVTLANGVQPFNATVSYTWATQSYQITNLKINHKMNTLIPTGQSLTPSTSVFTSDDLVAPVTQALSQKLMFGPSWTLATGITATNIKTEKTNPSVTINSANITGVVTINGINRTFTAKAWFQLDDDFYVITDLVISANASNLIPAMHGLTPAISIIAPSTTIFTADRLRPGLAIALKNHLPAGIQSSIVWAPSVYDIHKQGESNKAYAGVTATVKVNGILGKVLATVVYNADTGNFTFWNLHILVGESDATTPAISNLTPATNIFKTYAVLPSVKAQIKNNLPTKNSTIDNIMIRPIVDITVNKNAKGTIISAQARVSGRVMINGQSQTFSTTVIYTYASGLYTTTNLVWNDIPTTPANQVFNQTSLQTPLKTAFAKKLGANNVSQILTNNFDTSNVLYNKKTQTSTLLVTGTVYLNDTKMYNKFSIVVSYNFATQEYVTSQSTFTVGSANLGPAMSVTLPTNPFSGRNLEEPIKSYIANHSSLPNGSQFIISPNMHASNVTDVSVLIKGKSTIISYSATINGTIIIAGGINKHFTATALYDVKTQSYKIINFKIVA